MSLDRLGLPVGASEVLFWSLCGAAQTTLAVLAARLVVFGSLRVGPERFLDRIRRAVRRNDWVEVEKACRCFGGPFARLTRLHSSGRAQSQSCRNHSLDRDVGAILATVNTRVRFVRLLGVTSREPRARRGVLSPTARALEGQLTPRRRRCAGPPPGGGRPTGCPGGVTRG